MNRAFGTAGPYLAKEVRDPRPRKPLVAKKPIAPVNCVRREKKRARNLDYVHRRFIRSLPCIVMLQRRSDVQCAHVRAEGMGAAKGTWREVVPLCRELHLKVLHVVGLEEFQRTFVLPNLHALAALLVVADPDAPVHDQLACWQKFEEVAATEAERRKALQFAFDLTGLHVRPPEIR